MRTEILDCCIEPLTIDPLFARHVLNNELDITGDGDLLEAASIIVKVVKELVLDDASINKRSVMGYLLSDHFPCKYSTMDQLIIWCIP